MREVLDSLQNISASIACVICGHCHQDLVDSTTYSFPIIGVTCDNNNAIQIPGVPPVNRGTKTINEQALSVFHINTSSKTIYMTRIGGGINDVTVSGDYTQNDLILQYS